MVDKATEKEALDLISSSKALLEKQKATATKTPARKGTKKPKTKSASKKSTAASTPAVVSTPAVQAELVHAPVSGAGIVGTVRGDVAQTSPEELAANLVAIQQQQNTVLASQANKKLDKAIAVDQGLGLQVQLQQEKNATISESIATQSVKTQQQAAKTSLEGVKLSGLQIDLEGEAALLPHRSEGWAIKSEQMQIDNEGERALLPLRKQHWGAKLKLAQVGLQKLNAQIQQEVSELYAPVAITQHDD